MKTLVVLLVLAVLGLLWMRHENSTLRTSFDKSNRLASEQKLAIGTLTRQLSLATEQAEKNEQAQVELRQKLTAAEAREAQREKTIMRLFNENEAFRRWYNTSLPDAVRRLHQRPACADASDCLENLPESQPLPDAGQRPGS